MDEVGFSEILSVMAETGSPECHILQQFLMSVQFFVLYFFPHRHLPSCTDLLGFLRPASLCCCHSGSIHISQSMIRKTHFINIAFTNRFPQCIHTCFVHCPSISFTTFVSQREKYILTVYSPLASYMYILWLDRFISLHTALCSSTLDPFSPKAKSPVSWLGFNKCSLLLTSYFSKKNYSGGKGGGAGMDRSVCLHLSLGSVFRTSLHCWSECQTAFSPAVHQQNGRCSSCHFWARQRSEMSAPVLRAARFISLVQYVCNCTGFESLFF